MELDAQAFKDTLSCFPSGVTVVTSLLDGVPSGMTVSAFAAVSLTPPRISICVNQDAETRPAIETSRHFAVHILGRRQAELGMRFAHLLPDVPVPFAGLKYGAAVSGSPILPDCVAWLDCALESTIVVGDHKLFIGIPLAVDPAAGSDEPIVYCQRNWRVLEPL
jgi:3-hydroxy-9,10-secoandrosta-1,3,5(10)-triene-9,17-dione monooxygenase reductase component